MKLNNEICISFLQGSGWLQKHDKVLAMCAKDTIIDKFAKRIKEELEDNGTCNMIAINIIAQELKEEVLK